MDILGYLHHLQQAELALAQSHRNVAQAHAGDPAPAALFLAMAGQSQSHAQALAPMLQRYADVATGDFGSEVTDFFRPPMAQAEGTWFFDLQGLYLSACLVDLAWSVLMQLGEQKKDRDLVRLVERSTAETGKQLAWIKKRIKLDSWPAPRPLAALRSP